MEIFLSPQPLASLNSVIYLSKKISAPVRAEIDKWSVIYIEQGYSIKVRNFNRVWFDLVIEIFEQ